MTHRRLTAKHLRILYLLNESHWPVIYSYGLFLFTVFSSMGDGKLLIHGNFLQCNRNDTEMRMPGATAQHLLCLHCSVNDTGVQFQFVANFNAWAIIFFTNIFIIQHCRIDSVKHIKFRIIQKIHPPPLIQASFSWPNLEKKDSERGNDGGHWYWTQRRR